MLESRRKFLNTALVGNLILSCGLFLTTLFLLETPYIGFDAFCTAGLMIVYAFMAIVVLNKSPSAYSTGFLVGASLLVLVLAFEGAIYWGLIATNNGSRKIASIIACIFHATIFVVQLTVTYVIVKSKEDVIDTYAAYEYIPDSGYADHHHLSTSNSNSSPISYQAAVPTADI